MTFIGNYWWAILAIAGAIIYTWRVVRRASRSANLGATEGADNQATARAPALRLYLVVLAAAAVAARQVARGFPLVHWEVGDYLVAAAIGGVVALAFAIRRVALFPGPQPRTSDGMFLRAFLGLALGATLGGALLVIANGYLDTATVREVRTVVAGRDCRDGANALILHGAPDLPTAATSLRITRHTASCRDVEPGDTVFLAVKPGFFGRPWIQGAHVQTAQERLRVLLDRRRVQRP